MEADAHYDAGYSTTLANLARYSAMAAFNLAYSHAIYFWYSSSKVSRNPGRLEQSDEVGSF